MHDAGLQSSLGDASVSNDSVCWTGTASGQVYPDVLVDDEAAQALQRAQLQEARHRVGKLPRVGGGARQARARVSEGPVLRVPDGALSQVHDGPCPSTSELLVEAKPAVGVFHSGVEGPAVGAEALAEQVAVLGALPQEEGAIRHVDQLALRLPACDGPPVPALPVQLLELLRQAGHHREAPALHRVRYPGHPGGRAGVEIQVAAHALSHVGAWAGQPPKVLRL